MRIVTLACTLSFFTVVLSAQDIVEITSETKDGKLIYESWCARCHGMDGTGIVEGLDLDTPVPDLSDCSFNSREPRRDWKAVILHGGPARGLSMTMPSWSEAITEEQADAIIDHIKTFCTDKSWPSGELNFRRPQITGKAFPENEALLIPTYQYKKSGMATAKLVYESRIGPLGQWELSVPFVSRAIPAANGMGDIEIAGKYTVFHDEPSFSIISVGLEAGLPTGNRERSLGTGNWKLSPFIAAAKGIESLFLQSSIKLEKPLTPSAETELLYNVALAFPLTNEKKGLFPMVEFNGVQVVGESRYTLFVTPQMYVGLVKRGHIAFSFGVQIPFAGEIPFLYRIVTFFLWEYADGGLWW